jgi:hypothetical protein
LIEKDNNATPVIIINNGWKLIIGAEKNFDHLIGDSPKSLAIVPLLYFYSDKGRYVRSLLYGFIYWLLSGSKDEVLNRKRVFCAYRGDFEETLRENKEDIISRISRNIGSGPEVTIPTARYYEGLLQLLVKQRSKNLSPEEFQQSHEELLNKLNPGKQRSQRRTPVKSRTFTPRQKSTIMIRNLLDNSIKCGICDGMLDPSGGVQHDHILEASKGGPTDISNQRAVHPFCNNQRESIEQIRGGKQSVKLPQLIKQDIDQPGKQLSFALPDFF